ncbi:hypothetical protein F4801DRAFT_580287 [Xylaria longipes]|nr:hypothetical protein F4801DRAFT_580287 [Xylaria longipes]
MGCSDGGIGAAMAKTLRQMDSSVFATIRNTSNTKTMTNLSNVDIIELDATSEGFMARCAEQVKERTGGSLDILVQQRRSHFPHATTRHATMGQKCFFDILLH